MSNFSQHSQRLLLELNLGFNTTIEKYKSFPDFFQIAVVLGENGCFAYSAEYNQFYGFQKDALEWEEILEFDLHIFINELLIHFDMLTPRTCRFQFRQLIINELKIQAPKIRVDKWTQLVLEDNQNQDKTNLDEKDPT